MLSDGKLEHELLQKSRKGDIINLSIQYSIVSKFTSFVAIEERSPEDEDQGPGPSVAELLARESVDRLDYMAWAVDTSSDDVGPAERIAALRHEASIFRATSAFQAQRALTDAWNLASAELQPTDPVLADLALDMADFLERDMHNTAQLVSPLAHRQHASPLTRGSFVFKLQVDFLAPFVPVRTTACPQFQQLADWYERLTRPAVLEDSSSESGSSLYSSATFSDRDSDDDDNDMDGSKMR